ncbi:PAS domain S-box protein [Paracoccus gahaiensis]|uniref:histidine kinase n=1 Tax=Paracoccus gahaiensis TaxID=1706839 RepID=A0A4U0R6D0_9RHOB|nr:HWE histidine kinase domain-containing protein [Paracoccus gahaiensis]TJZ89950.1 PAS domain S-box protein [Paracoccus gahaiensis]
MSQPAKNVEAQLPFLDGGGEMADLIRRHDWSLTPLGPINAWPEALKAAVRIVLRTPIPIVMLWGPEGVMIYNDGYIEFVADRHPGMLGKPVREGWAEVADFNDNVMKVCLAGGTLSYVDQELTLYRNGRAEPVWMNLDYSPVLDETGRPMGVLAIVIETTARVLADRWNAEEQDRLQRMFEQAPSFMAMMRGENHIFEMVNPGYMRLVGNRTVLGRSVLEALPEVASQAFIDMLDTAYSTGEAITGTATPILLQREEGPPPELQYVDFVFQPIRDRWKVVTHIFVQGSDVTERVEAEQHQRLLMNELKHRVKNTLSVVNAIAARTLRGAISVEEAHSSLSARIIALSRAQDILTQQGGNAANICDVVTAATGLHDDSSGRFQVNGPRLDLNSRAALSFSLALHELATNAIKYGALSTDAGRVRINWSVESREGVSLLHFSWEETGGPTVSLPLRRGFGSTLIEDAVAVETDGTACLDYRLGGVYFTLNAPLSAILEI